MSIESIPEPGLTLDEAASQEAEDIVRVQKAAWLQTYPNEHIGITSEMIEKRFENINRRIQKWQEKIADDHSKMWTIKSDDVVIGFCGIEIGEDANRLSSIYVDPDHQGSGAGSKLIQTAIEYLGREKDILVDVASYNENAIDFYKRNGFEEMGDVPEEDVIHLDNIEMPETRMVLKALIE